MTYIGILKIFNLENFCLNWNVLNEVGENKKCPTFQHKLGIQHKTAQRFRITNSTFRLYVRIFFDKYFWSYPRFLSNRVMLRWCGEDRRVEHVGWCQFHQTLNRRQKLIKAKNWHFSCDSRNNALLYALSKILTEIGH